MRAQNSRADSGGFSGNCVGERLAGEGANDLPNGAYLSDRRLDAGTVGDCAEDEVAVEDAFDEADVLDLSPVGTVGGLVGVVPVAHVLVEMSGDECDAIVVKLKVACSGDEGLNDGVEGVKGGLGRRTLVAFDVTDVDANRSDDGVVVPEAKRVAADVVLALVLEVWVRVGSLESDGMVQGPKGTRFSGRVGALIGLALSAALGAVVV